MGDFLNEFAVNLLPTLAVFSALSLPIFGYFYNRLMNRLHGRNEHTSLFVAIGVSVTLLVSGLFSWRSMLLSFILFGLSGLPMIVGEFKRTEKTVHAPRRKRIPYAANGCIEDAHDAMKESLRLVCLAMKANGKNIESAIPLAHASTEINRAMAKIVELRLIQQIQE